MLTFNNFYNLPIDSNVDCDMITELAFVYMGVMYNKRFHQTNAPVYAPVFAPIEIHGISSVSVCYLDLSLPNRFTKDLNTGICLFLIGSRDLNTGILISPLF